MTRLRLRFSHLNEHKFRHGFLHSLNPLCNCCFEVEDNEHFFLRRLNFENVRRSFFIHKPSINYSFKNLPSHLKVKLLLFGDSKLSAIDSNLILKASIKYVMTTNRFSVQWLRYCSVWEMSLSWLSLCKMFFICFLSCLIEINYIVEKKKKSWHIQNLTHIHITMKHLSWNILSKSSVALTYLEPWYIHNSGIFWNQGKFRALPNV